MGTYFVGWLQAVTGNSRAGVSADVGVAGVLGDANAVLEAAGTAGAYTGYIRMGAEG